MRVWLFIRNLLAWLELKGRFKFLLPSLPKIMPHLKFCPRLTFRQLHVRSCCTSVPLSARNLRTFSNGDRALLHRRDTVLRKLPGRTHPRGRMPAKRPFRHTLASPLNTDNSAIRAQLDKWRPATTPAWCLAKSWCSAAI